MQEEGEQQQHTGDANTDRPLANAAGIPITSPASIVVRTSKYANFARDTIPHGTGTAQGVLMVYNGLYELILRDRNDLLNFPAKK